MNWGERGGCDTNTQSTTGPTSLWLPLPKGTFPSWPPVLSDKPSTRSAWEMQVIGSDTRAGEGGRGRANLDTGPSAEQHPSATRHASDSPARFLPVPPSPRPSSPGRLHPRLPFCWCSGWCGPHRGTRTWSQVSRSSLGFPQAFSSLCYKRERTPRSSRGCRGVWLRLCSCGHLAQGLAPEWFAQNTGHPPPL